MQAVAQIEHNCNDYIKKASVVVLNHLQEVGVMNSHIYDHIVTEKVMDIMRSIELFIGIIFIAGVVGFVCLAAV